MTKSFPDFVAKDGWTDVYSLPEYAMLAGTKVFVQNKEGAKLLIWAGGENAPTGLTIDDGGYLLAGLGMEYLTDHLWIRGNARVCLTQDDNDGTAYPTLSEPPSLSFSPVGSGGDFEFSFESDNATSATVEWLVDDVVIETENFTF